MIDLTPILTHYYAVGGPQALINNNPRAVQKAFVFKSVSLYNTAVKQTVFGRLMPLAELINKGAIIAAPIDLGQLMVLGSGKMGSKRHHAPHASDGDR